MSNIIIQGLKSNLLITAGYKGRLVKLVMREFLRGNSLITREINGDSFLRKND